MAILVGRRAEHGGAGAGNQSIIVGNEWIKILHF